MTQEQKLINVELDLTKPVTALVEKIASGVGVLYEPRRIVLKAKADAEAKKILSKADTSIQNIEKRATQRLVREEVKKQINMENMIEKSLAYLTTDSSPETMDDDWLTNLFHHARNTSDEVMQDTWARILAGEANTNGSYTKRTVNMMAELEKSDAVLFSKLVDYCWNFNGDVPIVFDTDDDIYEKNGITFSKLNHLASIGLVTFETLAGYVQSQDGTGGKFECSYQGTNYTIQKPEGKESKVSIGKILFTQQGLELAQVCTRERIDSFEEYVIKKLESDGSIVNKAVI